MIDVQNMDNRGTRLIVQGNQSMSWRANLWLAAGLAVICLGMAFVMAGFGYWMIIPFAGLEVVFVTWCLYLTVRKLARKEVITVSDDDVKLEWGYQYPDTTVDLPRSFARLHYDCPDSEFEVGHLSLGAFGKHYPLGLSLGRDEKKSLFVALDSALDGSSTKRDFGQS